MEMLKGFREFALRSNVDDMAADILIGSAFGKAVSSLVAAVTLNYDRFVQTAIVFAIFIVIETMNALKKREETAPPRRLHHRGRKCSSWRSATCSRTSAAVLGRTAARCAAEQIRAHPFLIRITHPRCSTREDNGHGQ